MFTHYQIVMSATWELSLLHEYNTRRVIGQSVPATGPGVDRTRAGVGRVLASGEIGVLLSPKLAEFFQIQGGVFHVEQSVHGLSRTDLDKQ